MRTDAFDYDLPHDRVAQRPAEPRDSARLLVLDRVTGRIDHRVFRDLPELLASGDLLVANDSRVMPARIRGTKLETGGAVEALLLRPMGGGRWKALVRGRVRPGTRLRFSAPDGTSASATVTEADEDGTRTLAFDGPLEAELDRLGDVPLPPYIKEPLADPERYQTVYARVAGSAAAPTAGLHFTAELVERLATRGIGVAFVTLHVGLDTFRPLEGERIDAHALHAEWAEVPQDTARRVMATRAAGGRCVAIGTTSVRALETATRSGGRPTAPRAFAGWTELYITPGFRFRAVDALVTNFHLPRTSLLVLVAAFAGKALVDRAYREAIDAGYRFYSFGDAMLVL